MQKQNSASEKTGEKPDAQKSEKHLCPFCEKEFGSKLGLKKHLPRCEASPDEDAPDEPVEEGIKLFDDEKLDSGADEDDYECGYCSFKMPKPYKRCPECGEELVWG